MVTDIAPARAYFDAWNRHDADAVIAAFADGATMWDVTMEEPVSVVSLRAGFAGLMAGFPNLHVEVTHLAAAGDSVVAAEWRMTGTSADGSKSLNLPGADLFEVAGDRISAARAYFNPGRFT